jgi:predicted MFS family arabinose efflux permease
MAGTLFGSLLGPRAGASRARLLASSLMAAALAEVLLYATPSAGIATASLGTTLLGVGFGLAAAPLNGLPGQLFPRQAASALVSLHSVLACGFAIGPLLVARAIETQLWVAVPISVGALAVLLAIAAVFTIPEDATRSQAGVRSGEASGSPQIRLLFIGIVVLYALAEGTFANWAVVYLREERGVGEAPAALALAVFWFALTLGRLTVSALLRAVPAEPIWCALPVAMLSVFLGLPFVTTAQHGVAAFALAGFACSAFFPLSVSLAGRHFAGGPARASSLLTAALMIGVGIGSFVIGPLRATSSIASLYRISAVYPLLVLVLCAQVVRAARSPAAAAAAEHVTH